MKLRYWNIAHTGNTLTLAPTETSIENTNITVLDLKLAIWYYGDL